MKKEFEDYLWDRMGGFYEAKPFVRDIVQEMINLKMINSPKQAWRTLDKWVDKGIYEYGSVFDLGWKCRKIENKIIEN